MDPIEIRVTGTDDSGKALASAEKGLKGVGDAGEKTGKQLKDSGKGAEALGSDVKDMGSSLAGAEADVEQLGATAEDAGKRIKGAGSGVRDFGDKARKSGEDADETAGHLDRMGEAGGNAESQFLGLGAGISGVSTLMKGGSLSAEDMAMSVADIGDSIEHTVVPWVGKAKDSIGSMIDRMGGVRGAAKAAAGAAGIGLLVAGLVALDQQAKEETSKSLDDLSLKLQGVNYASTPATEGLIQVMASVGKLDELWERAKMAGDEQALQFLELAENAGISKEQIAEYRSELDTKKAAEEAGVSATQRMTEAMKAEGDAIRGVSDARRAAVDPLFAMLDAMTGNRDAQREVNEAFVAYGDAVREHGEGSAEAASALRDLNSAQDDAVMSAADLESATSDLEAQIAEHPATLGNAINSLERWKAQGSITADQAARMETRFRNAAREANRIDGTSTRTLNARDNASGKIVNVGNRLSELDGRTATVYVNANTIIRKITEGFGFNAAGGPPAAFSTAASGGARGANVLVGEHGPELVNLPYGSMVKSNSDTERLLSDSGGGAATITWAGGPSDDLGMAIWRWIQQRVQVSYGGDVSRALGG